MTGAFRAEFAKESHPIQGGWACISGWVAYRIIEYVCRPLRLTAHWGSPSVSVRANRWSPCIKDASSE